VFKPTTNSSRFKKKTVSYYSSNKKFRRLLVGKINKSGRNVYGKIVNLNSCGSKKSTIKIDFIRRWSKKIALCVNITKDNNRTCFVSLIKYSNGTFSYILAASKLKPGNLVFSTIIPVRFSLPYNSGCSVILRYLNYKSIFFNLEIYEPMGGKYCKSGGTYSKIVSLNFDKNLVKIVLPTGSIKVLSMFNLVTIGRASNLENFNNFYSKAGYKRLMNYRPNVRGVAMNPVDNPHGGRTKTNSPELTPWGKIAKKGK